MDIKRLLGTRKARGLSQEKLSELTGVSRKTYSHWELGEREIKAIDLKKLSDILGVSMAYLMGDGDEEDFSEAKKAPKVGEFNNEGNTENMNVEIEICKDGTRMKLSIPPKFAENDINKIFAQLADVVA